MAMLDVWVARPGAACRVDDRDWMVRIEDAHGVAYAWAGTSYDSLPAPHAHWAGTIPPGTYVVRASRKAGKPGEPTNAEAAIVEVACDGIACVRLYVAPIPVRQPGTPTGGDKDPGRPPPGTRPPVTTRPPKEAP
jgi:hypothetical protein